MTQFSVDRKKFLDFLSCFGKSTTDLRLECTTSRITGEVAFAQYFFRRQFNGATVKEEGTLHIVFLEKAIAFLKASKQATVQFRQVSVTKPIHIESGGNKIQLPSSDDIISASKVPVVKRLLDRSLKNNWTSFAEDELTVHASIETKDLISLSSMKSLVSDNAEYKLRVHCGEKEFGIVAGKAISGRLFTTIPAKDCDGPNTTISSNFGKWLPTCFMYLDDGHARVHIGQDTVVIFEQDNTLLMIINESDV